MSSELICTHSYSSLLSYVTCRRTRHLIKKAHTPRGSVIVILLLLISFQITLAYFCSAKLTVQLKAKGKHLQIERTLRGTSLH